MNQAVQWDQIPDPVIIRGNPHICHRDPTGHYHDGVFRVFYTQSHREADGGHYYIVAVIESQDLVTWTEPKLITPKDMRLNYSSPGNVIRYNDQWLMSVQTLPRTPGDNHRARVFKMASDDLEHWDEPQMLRVKGPQVPVDQMGRMIDAYFVQDKDNDPKWWCFFKQCGVGMSFTYDFETWTYFGKVESGENVCVLVDRDQDEYVLIHAPRNGVGIKRSKNLTHWRDLGVWTLGQSKAWAWAAGRLSAAHVLDLRSEPAVGKYVMVFHGSTVEGVRQRETHGESSLGLAWSDDLINWCWPGREA